VKKNIEDYLFLKENFLKEDFCEHSIDILSKANWKKHEFDKPEEEQAGIPLSDMSKESEMLDFNSISNIILRQEIEKIVTEMMLNIPEILMEYLTSFKFEWLRGWRGYSGIKFNRYSPGQEMQAHWDNVNSIFPGEVTGIPFLSVIGFLNDDYEGGELILCEDKKIDKKKGNLLIFPSSFMYPHQVTPLTKGTRYSYVSWVY
jgi:hypothetical protein